MRVKYIAPDGGRRGEQRTGGEQRRVVVCQRAGDGHDEVVAVAGGEHAIHIPNVERTLPCCIHDFGTVTFLQWH